MMLTQDEVLAELEARGCEISPRRLVDWRQKQLLPPLVKHGRGRGRAWIYGWEDPCIVEQVIAVQKLLRIHGRTAWLFTPLWCLGFDVPLERVQPQLRGLVEGYQLRLTGGERDPDELGFRLSEVAVATGIRPGLKGSRPQLPVEAIEYWLNLLAGDAAYAPERKVLRQIATTLWRNSGREALEGTPLGTWRLSADDLRRVRRWIRQHAALPRLAEAARKANEAEWEAVHADWQALAQLVRTTGSIAEGEEWEEFASLSRRIVAVVGPWLSLVDLSMRSHGLSTQLDRARQELVDFTDRLETDSEMHRQVREIWSGMRAHEEPLDPPPNQVDHLADDLVLGNVPGELRVPAPGAMSQDVVAADVVGDSEPAAPRHRDEYEVAMIRGGSGGGGPPPLCRITRSESAG